MGGCQSLHTNSLDEAVALPTTFSARIARNTQLILQEETGIPSVVDPWGGSYMMESLTSEMIEEASKIIAEVKERGGMTACIESGWAKRRIEESAAARQAMIDSGKEVVVGVNKYKPSKEENFAAEVRKVDNASVRQQQIERIAEVRRKRDSAAAEAALKKVTEACKSETENILTVAIEAARARCTLGEITNAMEEVFGRYTAKNDLVSGVYYNTFSHCKEAEAQLVAVREAVSKFEKIAGRRPRILVAKMGQDGHDRGAKVISTGFADLGFDVDVGPLFNTPEEVARHAVESDVHVVGASSQAAGHRTLIPGLVEELKKQDAKDIAVIAGGVIPHEDYEFLEKAGVSLIFGPGSPVQHCALKVVELLISKVQKDSA